MAQIGTDFTDSMTFTERWNTTAYATSIQTSGLPAGATNGAALRIALTLTAGHYAVTPSLFAGTFNGDVELVGKFMHAGTTDSTLPFGLVIHGGGLNVTMSGYVGRLHNYHLNGTKQITEFDGAGSSSNVASSPFGEGGARNAWFWLRFQRSGTALRLKIWADGDPEPGTWTVQGTDDTYGSGWVGIYTAISAGTVWCDWLGMGTAGDPAPLPPVAGESKIAAIMHHRRMQGMS